MDFKFYKFDGAGNDFVIIDSRDRELGLTADQIARVCHRRFGVGADGLMLLTDGGEEYDFRMTYYNSDGHTAEMCGNGGRCIAMFAYLLGMGSAGKPYLGQEPDRGFSIAYNFGMLQAQEEMARPRLYFLASDGPHDAEIIQWDETGQMGLVKLGMRDVERDSIVRVLDGYLLNTGVPHYVQKVSDLEHFDVAGEGRRLRHHPALGPEGANVNFVEEQSDGTLLVRTYERGVEDETWACGTGVTACAIVTGNQHLATRGGSFRVDFRRGMDCFTDVYLTGPVSLNFTGKYRMN